jgi:hypothetical protein
VNLPFNIDSALQNISKVNLRGGVVGKVTIAVIASCLCMALVAWSAQNIWLSAAALAGIFALAFPMLWRLISFADRHPQAALLEGAEFLVHEQLLQATKGHPALTIEPTDRVQPVEIEGASANLQIALQPDIEGEPARLENSGGRQ